MRFLRIRKSTLWFLGNLNLTNVGQNLDCNLLDKDKNQFVAIKSLNTCRIGHVWIMFTGSEQKSGRSMFTSNSYELV